jgi:hypothetical protein
MAIPNPDARASAIFVWLPSTPTPASWAKAGAAENMKIIKPSMTRKRAIATTSELLFVEPF